MKFRKISAILIIAALAICASVIPSFSMQEGAAAQSNLFERIFSAISSNLAEILCALTLVGSIVLTIAYKRGLLPLVRGALSAIGKSVGKLGCEAESFNKESGANIASMKEKLDIAASVIDGFAQRLSLLEDELKKISDGTERFTAIKKAVEAEAELLYDVFMSSALPEYQKEAVAKKVAQINGSLKEG